MDGLKFKDLNGNGVLDVYEDWREDADTRTADLLAQMTIRERISQMQHPTFTPKDNGSYPNYLKKWMSTENIGMVLVREFNVANSAATAATTMNKVPGVVRGIPPGRAGGGQHGLGARRLVCQRRDGHRPQPVSGPRRATRIWSPASLRFSAMS